MRDWNPARHASIADSCEDAPAALSEPLNATASGADDSAAVDAVDAGWVESVGSSFEGEHAASASVSTVAVAMTPVRVAIFTVEFLTCLGPGHLPDFTQSKERR